MNYVLRKLVCLLFVAFVPCVSAEVVINQVLYDPVNTEAGGEAVELKNIGSSAVDMSGWVIATDSSDKDATLPQNAVLQAGQTYLVADENWTQNKDGTSWRAADYMEKITLGNSNSGVALLSNGTLIDALGWGNASLIKAGLVKGSAASQVLEGWTLLRTQNTGDNAEDFVAVRADFQEGIPVPVTADITISVPQIEVSKSVNLAPEGTLVIKNNGAQEVRVNVVLGDFYYKNLTLPKTQVSANGPLETTILPQSEYKVVLRIDAQNAVPGRYSSTMHVVVVKE